MTNHANGGFSLFLSGIRLLDDDGDKGFGLSSDSLNSFSFLSSATDRAASNNRGSDSRVHIRVNRGNDTVASESVDVSATLFAMAQKAAIQRIQKLANDIAQSDVQDKIQDQSADNDVIAPATSNAKNTDEDQSADNDTAKPQNAAPDFVADIVPPADIKPGEGSQRAPQSRPNWGQSNARELFEDKNAAPENDDSDTDAAPDTVSMPPMGPGGLNSLLGGFGVGSMRLSDSVVIDVDGNGGVNNLAPDANDDVNNMGSNRTVNGNVITGENGGQNAEDSLGDGDTLVTEVLYNGESYEVPSEGTVTIQGRYGTLEISADGSYSYTQLDNIDLSDVDTTTIHRDVSSLSPAQEDFSGEVSSFTKNGITITSYDPDNPDAGNGSMTYISPDKGSGGLGIFGNRDGSGPADIVSIELEKSADEVTISLADFGDHFDDLITFQVYEVGSQQPVEVKMVLPSTSDQGHTDFTFNADDLGFEGEISQIDLSSAPISRYGDREADFLLVDVVVSDIVEIDHGEAGFEDEFDYILTDNATAGSDDGTEMIAFSLGGADVPTNEYDMNRLWQQEIDGHQISVAAYKDLDRGKFGQFGFETKGGITRGIGVKGGGDAEIQQGEGIAISFDGVVLNDLTIGVRALFVEGQPADGVETGTWIAYRGNEEVCTGDFDAQPGASDGRLEFDISVDGGFDRIVFTSHEAGGDYHLEYVNGEWPVIGEPIHKDFDTAKLTIKGVAAEDSKFLTGTNVDDMEDSTEAYAIGNGNGIITGGNNQDILIGDAGGSSVELQQQDYNVVLMLDISGSMYGTNLSYLKDAIDGLITEFNAYENGDIKVHIVPFSHQVTDTQTFTVTEQTGYDASLTYLHNLTTTGATNYEAALQKGIEWLQSGDAIEDALTVSYFVSDGYPNYAIDDNTGNFFYTRTTVTQSYMERAMGEIEGADGTNEVALLQSLSDEVFGVGIGSWALQANLDRIDSDGHSINVPAEELRASLEKTNPLGFFTAVGDDTISGGYEDDLIYGDTFNTDALAELHGLGLDAGAGLEVFLKLEQGYSATQPDWSREDTLAYVKNNMEALAEESLNEDGEGRLGGNDIIYGGSGNDTIFGQEGNDQINGGAGADILYGGTGSDTFLFDLLSDAVDLIRDFVSYEGDRLDVSQLLTDFDGLQDSIDDFVFLTEENGNTVVSVDRDGAGNKEQAEDIVILEGVQNALLEDVIADPTSLV